MHLQNYSIVSTAYVFINLPVLLRDCSISAGAWPQRCCVVSGLHGNYHIDNSIVWTTYIFFCVIFHCTVMHEVYWCCPVLCCAKLCCAMVWYAVLTCGVKIDVV